MTLSPAQHQQRRDAANARWAHARAAAAALAGGAAGAGLGYAAVKPGARLLARAANYVRPHIVARHLPDQEQLRQVAGRRLFTRLNLLDDAVDARHAAIDRGFTKPLDREKPAKPSVVGLFARHLRRQNYADLKQRDLLMSLGRDAVEAGDEDLMDLYGDALASLERDITARTASIDALHQLRPARKQQRAEAFPERKAPEWDVHVPNQAPADGPKTGLAAAPRGLNRRIVTAKGDVGKVGYRAQTEAKVKSDLKPEDAKKIRDQLRGQVARLATKLEAYERRKAPANLPGDTALLAERFRRAVDLKVNREIRATVARTVSRSRPVLIGAGLLGGAFAAARAEQAFEHRKPLAKGDPQDSSPPPGKSTGERLITAAENVEASLARGVNKALVGWRDLVTPESVMAPNSQGGLFEGLDAPLAAGMAPLDDATSDGLTAPASIIPPDDGSAAGGDGPKILRFGFDLRAQGVEDFARRYRMDRVREISNGQRATLRQLIAEASTSGSPPAETARKIRDVIGLTSYQAAIVQNYRKMLETNDARALTFALRDRRFDRTVARAVNDAGDLTPAQVDKMTAVYRARMIASRAVTIARTESLRATNNAHATSVANWLGKNPGYTTIKVWMATDDDRTRHDHRLLNGQHVVGMRTPFVCDDGSTLLWPHDPKGTAAQVVRCRCAFATVLIPRAQTGFFDPGFFSQNGAFNGPSTPYDEPTPDQIFGSPEMQPA
jgi:hypothetical protein